MTNIRRYLCEGQVYFLTHVTFERTPILTEHTDISWSAYSSTIGSTNAETIAWAILPDHFHLIFDPKDGDLSSLMKRFKLKFSGLYRSRYRLSSGRLWQYRFWDHIIRNQEDLNRRIDYVHYNPVKHHMVTDPFEYEHSSLQSFLNAGLYTRDWGCHGTIHFEGSFGE